MRFAKNVYDKIQSPLAIHSPRRHFPMIIQLAIPLSLSSSNNMFLGHSNLDKLPSTLYRMLPSSSYATLIVFSGRITYSGTACTPFFIHFHPVLPSDFSTTYPCSDAGLYFESLLLRIRVIGWKYSFVAPLVPSPGSRG